MNDGTQRFLVFRSAKSNDFLCACAARSRTLALKIARRMFRLERTAWAIEERSA